MLTYEKQALSGTIEVLLRSELPDEFEGTKLYGSVEEDELRQDCKIFRLSNETGHGRITVYQVFSGIELYYNDMHMGYCNQNQATAKNMIEFRKNMFNRRIGPHDAATVSFANIFLYVVQINIQ